jgi:hypothetical protein
VRRREDDLEESRGSEGSFEFISAQKTRRWVTMPAARRLAAILAAEIVRRPGERQPRLFERIPQGLRPHALLGIVDRGGLAQILKDPGSGIDDNVVRVSLIAAVTSLRSGTRDHVRI